MFEETAIHTFEPATSLPQVTLEVPCKPVLEVAQHSPELRPKSAAELASDYGVSDKTIQTWYKAVCAAYCWLDSKVLKTGSSNKTRYTPICQELIAQYRVAVKDLSEEAWIASIHAANPDKIASETPVPPASASEVPIAGRLNLPTIAPVSSAIVPSGQMLPTDTREAKTLAATGKQAIEDNSQDLEKIRKLLEQVNSFVDSKINQLDQETEATQRQVQELKDLAFQLEVKQESLRRAEIRNAAVREESEVAKVTATNKVVSLSDFFAKKSASQSGS